MDVNLHYAGIELPLHHYLTVKGAQGTRVLCLHGELWITQDGDRADHFVRPGDAFEIGVRGTVVVHAHRAARLLLLEPTLRPRAGWLARWFGPAHIDRPPPTLVQLHGA